MVSSESIQRFGVAHSIEFLAGFNLFKSVARDVAPQVLKNAILTLAGAEVFTLAIVAGSLATLKLSRASTKIPNPLKVLRND